MFNSNDEHSDLPTMAGQRSRLYVQGQATLIGCFSPSSPLASGFTRVCLAREAPKSTQSSPGRPKPSQISQRRGQWATPLVDSLVEATQEASTEQAMPR